MGTNKTNWMLKAPNQLKEKLDRIRIERIKNGKDKQMVSYKRLCLAISRHDKLFNDLANADFIKDNKAQFSVNGESSGVFSIFQFMIVAFLTVLLFAGLIYAQGLLTDVFYQVGIQNEVNAGQPGYTNMTYAAQATFGELDDAIQSLKMVAAVYILGLAICIILTNALLKINPLFFFPYILLSLLAVVFAVPISNAYESLLNSSVFAGELAGFSISNWILLKLPIFVLIVSVLGGMFLFINYIRSGSEGEFR